MSDATDANLIRGFIDGELSAVEEAELRRRMDASPEARAEIEHQIASERRLKNAVARVMLNDAPAAPPMLRAHVQAALVEPVVAAEVIEPAAVTRARAARRFVLPQRANFFAVAATLTVIAGAVLWGIFGRSIDESPPPSPGAQLVAQSAIYVDQQHNLCRTDAQHLTRKMIFKTPPEAQKGLSAELGAPVQVFDLSAAGYEFIGAGPCHVPLGPRSAHISYRRRPRDDGRSLDFGSGGLAGRAMVSLFIVPRSGCPAGACAGWDLDRWYLSDASIHCDHDVMQCASVGLIYFLVCCDSDDVPRVIDAIADQLPAAPEKPAR